MFCGGRRCAGAIVSRQCCGTVGVAPPDPDAPHILNLNVGVAEGYDTDVQAEFGSVSQDSPRIDSFYSELLASGEYRWQGQHVDFGATGASTVKYYQSLDEFRNVGESAGVGMSAQLAPRTNLFANASASYSPSYLYGLFPTMGELAPGDSIPSAPDYGVTTQASYNYGGVVRLTHALSARDGVSFGGDLSHTNFVQETDFQQDFNNYGVQATYARSLSAHSMLNVVYQYRRGQLGYGRLEETSENGFGMGVQLTKPLSATRKVVFGFNGGASAVDAPAAVDAPDAVAAERPAGRFYQGVGDVSVAYDFGRTWQIRGACQRGVQYLAVLRDPVVTSGFSTAVDGLLSGRVLFTASAGYSTGVSAFNLNSSTAFTTYTGVVRVSRAATRTLSGVRRVSLLLLRLSRVSPTTAWPSSTTAEERRTRRAHVVAARDRKVTCSPDRSITPEDVLAVLKRWWWLVVPPLAIGLALGVLASGSSPRSTSPRR